MPKKWIGMNTWAANSGIKFVVTKTEKNPTTLIKEHVKCP